MHRRRFVSYTCLPCYLSSSSNCVCNAPTGLVDAELEADLEAERERYLQRYTESATGQAGEPFADAASADAAVRHRYKRAKQLKKQLQPAPTGNRKGTFTAELLGALAPDPPTIWTYCLAWLWDYTMEDFVTWRQLVETEKT